MKYMAIAVFIVFFLVSLTFSGIIHVPADTSTIQGGIYLASDGDTVLVAEDTYFENINFKGKSITIASLFITDGDTSHISKTIIDGSQPSHPDSGSVVYFKSGEDTTSVLCGFTITGGSGTHVASINRSGGGGIIMFSGGKIRNNKITGNYVHVVIQHEIGGGGLAFNPSNKTNLIVEHNEFTQNSLVGTENSSGGGLWLGPRWNDGYIRVNNNLISNNSVTCTGTYKALGGGIGVSLNLPTKGTILIEKNLISKNELHCVASIGAGIYVVYFEPGGVITDNNPNPLIYNNIIANNYSEDRGAGIGIWTIEKNHQASSVINPQPVIINNTIVNNKANDGSGIFNFDSYPLLLNNIFWNDLSAEGSREIFNDDINYPEYLDKINNGELFVYYSDIQGGWEGWGNIDADPMFSDTLFHLSEGSLCIDAGYDSSFFNDIEDEGSAGFAKWPAMGTLRNDQGAYGGPQEYDVIDLKDVTDFILDIPDKSINLPLKFGLSQNYPNPFNPSTKIEFTLPKSEFTTLKIYNILGKEIAILVYDNLQAGNHTYQFNGSNLASGIYYYRIESGEFQDVKKMVLLR